VPAGLQPAWVLHRRSYGDGGFLVELLTLDEGRLAVVLRGARRKARGGSTGGLVQPFIPLLVELGGKGELKLLKRVESASPAVALSGKSVFSGLYLNELLIRVLPRFDPHPALFARYGTCLPRLADADAELVIRELELALLDELGYGLRFELDAEGAVIDPELQYRFDPERGFIPNRFLQQHSNAADAPPSIVAGHALLTIGRWWVQGQSLPGSERRVLKSVVRHALARHIGERPLRSREMFRAFLKGQGRGVKQELEGSNETFTTRLGGASE